MRGVLFRKIIAGCIILSFLIIVMQPALGTDPVIPSITTKDEDIEPKEYLFQTIIDIVNNPEVKDILDQIESNDGLLSSDYNFRNIYLKIFFRNPRFIFSTLFTKPSITPEYLDFLYNNGCKIENIIGEDKANEIIESIAITDPELFDELDNIITENEELSSRIATLNEMNIEIEPETKSDGALVICSILALIFIPTFLIALMYYGLGQLFKENQALAGVFIVAYVIFAAISLGGYYIMLALGCLPAPAV